MIDDTATIARACMLLAVVVEEIRGLRADLAQRKQKRLRPLGDADRALLGALLPAVSSMFGDGEFRVGLLMQRAAERSSVAKRAKRAIAGMNALQLGRLFKRAADADVPIAGLYVHIVGHSRTGAVICVDAKSRDHRAATAIASTLRARLSP